MFKYFVDLDKNLHFSWTLKGHTAKDEIKQNLWSGIAMLRKNFSLLCKIMYRIRNESLQPQFCSTIQDDFKEMCHYQQFVENRTRNKLF
jgi:hypothetical protein